MQFIEFYIGSIILWVVAYFIGKVLLPKTSKVNVIKVVIIILLFSLFLTTLNIANSEILGGTLKILCVYILQYLYYRLIFRESRSKTMIMALIYYIFLFISEVIVAIFMSVLFWVLNKSIETMKNSIIINTLIASLEYILVVSIQKYLKPYVKNITVNKIDTHITIVIILITLALLTFKIPLSNWKFNLEFVVTMLILGGFCIVGLTVLRQKAQIQETTSKYLQLANYSDVTNDLLEDYRIVAHEHKNQLSVIRSMIDPDDIELLDYVDGLLEKREKIKYSWLGQLNHLPISGLKGLINYKLMEMEQKKLNINITVSKEVLKSKLKNLSIHQKDKLYSIIGVYLDNMIQAAEKSKRKEISIEIYKEKNNIVFLLANSYSGKIDADKIDNYGYTTKGKNHGIGLHIVRKIIEENKIFLQNRTILEDYYIQELKIDLNEINKKTAK